MKRIVILLIAIGVVTMSSISMAAMSSSKVRKNSRFLTDRMAYELNLSPQQYNDVYEINYDFIYGVRYLMDDVVMGNMWALEDYYQMLDYRNDDLRWVLTNYQYSRFLGLEYFNRPIFASGGGWNFRIYVVYPNVNFFYYAKPYHYRTYSGGHYRTHYDNRSYYSNRYKHDTYHGNHSFRDYDRYSRDDFKVSARPGTSTRPSSGSSTRPSSRPSRDDVYDSPRPSGSGTNRPSGTTTTTRPSNKPSSGSSSSSRPSGSTSRPGSSSTTNPSGTSTSRPSSSSRPSSENSSGRSSSSVKENNKSSRSSSSSSRSSERPSSSSSSESRSNSSGSERGGRR